LSSSLETGKTIRNDGLLEKRGSPKKNFKILSTTKTNERFPGRKQWKYERAQSGRGTQSAEGTNPVATREDRSPVFMSKKGFLGGVLKVTQRKKENSGKFTPGGDGTAKKKTRRPVDWSGERDQNSNSQPGKKKVRP